METISKIPSEGGKRATDEKASHGDNLPCCCWLALHRSQWGQSDLAVENISPSVPVIELSLHHLNIHSEAEWKTKMMIRWTCESRLCSYRVSYPVWTSVLYHINMNRGAWAAQSVKHLPSVGVNILGSWDWPCIGHPQWGVCFFFSLCSPCSWALSLSLLLSHSLSNK